MVAPSSGHYLSEYLDFWEGTGSAQITSPEGIINSAPSNTNLFGLMCGGSDAFKKMMVGGGSSLRWNIVFDHNGTFEAVRFGATRNYRNPQRLKRATAYWRMVEAHSTWQESEILLNDRIKFAGSYEARAQQYARIKFEKEMLLWTAIWEGLEAQLGAAPTADMEGETGDVPYSLFALVNEETNGLYTGFTTLHGIDPTDSEVNGKWQPQTQTYSSLAANNTGNLINAFSLMHRKLDFYVPPTHSEYWTSDTARKKRILMSSAGLMAYENSLRGENDRLVAGPQDPAYGSPMFKGVPVTYWGVLDTAPIYDDGASGRTTEALADITGPRAYFMDFNVIHPIFHDQLYFMQREVTKDHNVPDTWVAPVASLYNVVIKERRKCGVVSPSIDLEVPDQNTP